MEEKIISIISNHCPNVQSINMYSDLFYDLGISSLKMISLITDIEKELEITVDFREFHDVHTVNDLILYCKGLHK